jgi:hypothetical protein
LCSSLSPCAGTEGRRRYSCDPFERGWVVAPRPGRITSGKDPAPILQGPSLTSDPLWKGKKRFFPPGFDPRIVQPVASCYTNYGMEVYTHTHTHTHTHIYIYIYNKIVLCLMNPDISRLSFPKVTPKNRSRLVTRLYVISQ